MHSFLLAAQDALNWMVRVEEAVCDKSDGGISGRGKNVSKRKQGK